MSAAATEAPVALRERARRFALLALGVGHPSETTRELLLDAPGAAEEEGLAPLVRLLREGLAEAQSAWIQRFDAGRDRVPLYETEYGRMRGLAKGHDLADVVGFYRAFGFDLDPADGSEMADHLAVELEFYALLLQKSALLQEAADGDGPSIVLDARRKFLLDHLGRFVGAAAGRAAAAEDPVFAPLLSACAEVVREECGLLDVRPPPLDFYASQGDEETPANCGGDVAVPGMPELVPGPKRRR